MEKTLKQMSWKELRNSNISAKEFLANYNSGRMYAIKEEGGLDFNEVTFDFEDCSSSCHSMLVN